IEPPALNLLEASQDTDRISSGDLIVGDVVWRDSNKNGIQDRGEDGLAGVTVWFDLNDNGILEANELQRTTDNNGFYLFNTIAEGTWTLRVLASTLPQGFFEVSLYDDPNIQGAPTLGGNRVQLYITESDGQNLDVDWGYFLSAEPERFDDLGLFKRFESPKPAIPDTLLNPTIFSGVATPGSSVTLRITSASGSGYSSNAILVSSSGAWVLVGPDLPDDEPLSIDLIVTGQSYFPTVATTNGQSSLFYLSGLTEEVLTKDNSVNQDPTLLARPALDSLPVFKMIDEQQDFWEATAYQFLTKPAIPSGY
ncbi:MAG: hypothetical protein HRT56_03370, partial [Coraliomargarita sp.]|nr:hypothetical protein [Coraliomargarita sp.]